MNQRNKPRTDRDKLSIFRECFTGLTHVYGTYDPKTGQVRQVKEPVTDDVLLRHLKGQQPYGVYLLVGDRTRAVVADFDNEDANQPLQFVRQAKHYGIQAYVERSKSKGWHAWIFAEVPGVSAAKARLVVRAILQDIDAGTTEVFPKQDSLGASAQYGNFLNAPLFGTKVPQGRTVFVDPEAGFKPYPNQWDLLAGIERVGENLLDQIIQLNELAPADGANKAAPRPLRPVNSFQGLFPCARNMLEQGVTQYQRVACFRLAVQLRKVGLPVESTIAVLLDWAVRNQPADGKRKLTPDEVLEQAKSAYGGNYRSCGCEEPAVAAFCHSDCPLKRSASGRPEGRPQESPSDPAASRGESDARQASASTASQ